MKKILLIVLATFSFTFMTIGVVNAEEVIENQPEQQALNPLDNNALNVIDSDYQINKKESEMNLEVTSIIEMQNSIRNEYIQKLKDAGYDTSDMNNFYVSIQYSNGFPRKLNVTLNGTSKELNMVYSNTSNYNQTDANYIENQLKKLKTFKYNDNDSVMTVLDINDEEGAKNFSYKNYDFSTLLDDKTITMKVVSGESGFGGNPWGEVAVIYFFKNDVAYASKVITVLGTFGVKLDNGTPVSMEKQGENTDIYKEMAKEFEKQGFTNILGCYELTAYGSTYDNMKISFNVGTQYNGRIVKILHKKSDETWEVFKTTVENGKATITVSEFSPFMIALTDEVGTGFSNNAQTSSINIIFYVVLAINSLIGIIYIFKKKKIA